MKVLAIGKLSAGKFTKETHREPVIFADLVYSFGDTLYLRVFGALMFVCGIIYVVFPVPAFLCGTSRQYHRYCPVQINISRKTSLKKSLREIISGNRIVKE